MSFEPAIEAHGLAKRYRLGTNVSLDGGIRELIDSTVRRLAARGESAPRDRGFWALRDVGFALAPGSAVGLIGRNGAGKSTLLKLLGRITPPTAGEARIHGRIASLLEVGTGFQPDLTGRENVFLNGAILGMKRREVHARFDEIIAFAEIERFVDTPVKRYSSGMFTRLAFSVAAHLEADIMLVDEVLAVGDIAFQRRCLEKMGEVTGDGRTVIFVSHKLGAVRRLCQRVLYLHNGELVADGDTHEVLARYVRDTLHPDVEQDDPGARFARFESWSFEHAAAPDAHTAIAGDTVFMRVRLRVTHRLSDAWFRLALWGEDDEMVMSASSRDHGGATHTLETGLHDLCLSFPLPLRDGHYAVELSLEVDREQALERVELPPRLVVLPRGESHLPRSERGVLDVPVSFQVERR